MSTSLTNSSFGLGNDSPSISTPQSSTNTKEEKDEYFINMDRIRSKKMRKQPEDGLNVHSFHLGIEADVQLKKAVEREQNTRRLTLERQRKKQSKLLRSKQEKRIYDIALLIHKNNEYYKILCGPVIYEVFYGYIRFTNCQQYINHDIDILNKSAKMIEEIDGSHVFQYFCHYSPNDLQNGVTFDFADIARCQLYRFENNCKYKWDNHKYSQCHISCDVLIIVNNCHVPIYVLLDVLIDLIEESVQFCDVHQYQCGDDDILHSIANQLIDFELKRTFKFCKKDPSQSFEYNFNNTTTIFKFGVCHNFKCSESKKSFYYQKYDIALTTNDNDELVYLLNDVQYDVMNGKIEYSSIQIYRNGDYDELKECGKEVKCIKIKEFQSKYQSKYELNSITKQCILFNIKNIYLWSQYIKKQKTCHFDVATITDDDDYQTYILSDVTVNWIDQIIDFAVCDTFKARHNRIIGYYGELIMQDRISSFTLNGFKNEALNEIFFFELKSHSNKTVITITPPSIKDKPQLKNENTLVNLTQRDSIMPDRMSVLGRMQNVTKMKQRIMEKQSKPIQINRKNNTQNVVHINDELRRIWNEYIKIYGFEPDNVHQLKSFSKIQNNIKSLSYSEARDLFYFKTKNKCN